MSASLILYVNDPSCLELDLTVYSPLMRTLLERDEVFQPTQQMTSFSPPNTPCTIHFNDRNQCLSFKKSPIHD